MNTTPDYDLMFLVAKRDMAQIERNATANKLLEAKKIVNRLEFLDAPVHEKARAKRMVECLERAYEGHDKRLRLIRDKVAELDWSQA